MIEINLVNKEPCKMKAAILVCNNLLYFSGKLFDLNIPKYIKLIYFYEMVTKKMQKKKNVVHLSF